MIYQSKCYLSLTPWKPCFTLSPRMLIASSPLETLCCIHCLGPLPLSLEGRRSLHEYHQSSLSRMPELFSTLCITEKGELETGGVSSGIIGGRATGVNLLVRDPRGAGICCALATFHPMGCAVGTMFLVYWSYT